MPSPTGGGIGVLVAYVILGISLRGSHLSLGMALVSAPDAASPIS